MKLFSVSAVTLATLMAVSASAQAAGGATDYLTPTSSNTTAPSNWRIAPGMQFNGVAALDASALLTFTSSDGGTYACSGSLLAGGAYVLTAGHCGDDVVGTMTIQFLYSNGTAGVTRTASAADITLHPLWQGFDNSADAGSDLSLIKLNQAVTTINGYHLSTTNDVGKQMLIAGFGTSGTGGANGAPNWNDGNFGHYAFNTADVTSKNFNLTMNNYVSGWGANASFYTGTTYMFDFDDAANPAARNALQRVADATGNAWSSNAGVTGEGLIAGGDSGGGDFVWNGSEWLLSSVHSWGWQGNESDGSGLCDAVGITDCSPKKNNTSSFGDISGSTAVFDEVSWISSVVGSQVVVVAVPEPQTLLMFGAGLLVMVRLKRRRAA